MLEDVISGVVLHWSSSTWFADVSLYCSKMGSLILTDSLCKVPKRPSKRISLIAFLANICWSVLSFLNSCAQHFPRTSISSLLWWSQAIARSWFLPSHLTALLLSLVRFIFSPSCRLFVLCSWKKVQSVLTEIYICCNTLIIPFQNICKIFTGIIQWQGMENSSYRVGKMNFLSCSGNFWGGVF